MNIDWTGMVTAEEADGVARAEEHAGMTVSRLQGRLAPGQETCAALDAMAANPNTPWAMRETILGATQWNRTSQAMDQLGYALGFTPGEMDDLFRVAMKVQA